MTGGNSLANPVLQIFDREMRSGENFRHCQRTDRISRARLVVLRDLDRQPHRTVEIEPWVSELIGIHIRHESMMSFDELTGCLIARRPMPWMFDVDRQTVRHAFPATGQKVR